MSLLSSFQIIESDLCEQQDVQYKSCRSKKKRLKKKATKNIDNWRKEDCVYMTGGNIFMSPEMAVKIRNLGV